MQSVAVPQRRNLAPAGRRAMPVERAILCALEVWGSAINGSCRRNTGGRGLLALLCAGDSPRKFASCGGAGFGPTCAPMKKSGCAIVALFLALCLSMFVNGLLLLGLGARSTTGIRVAKQKSYEELIVADATGMSTDKIAVIPMEGLIAFGAAGSLGKSMVDDLKLAFEQAAEDKEVKAVVISVDSPGGEITASDVLFHELTRLRSKKPVVFYMNSIGASGAYYAACGASWVMCNETTFTGSIGVIISTLNYRELFGKVGLEAVVFKSGKFKDMLSGSREMTPEEKAYIEGLVMQSYGRFVGIVAQARQLNEQTLRNGVADGRILSGTDAFEAKLVDQLGYVEDAYAKAKELGGAPGAAVVRYKPGFSFENLFQLFGSSEARATVQIDLLPGMPKLKPGHTYLLPPFFAP
jgi:protease-4